MIEWFRNLTPANWIAIAAIVVPVIVGVIAGVMKLFRKEDSTATPHVALQQTGTGHRAIVADENRGAIAAGDIRTGIDGDAALDRLITVSREVGQSKAEIAHIQEEREALKDTIRQLEEALSQPRIEADSAGQRTPQPTQKAQELASLITEDDGLYAQALKAIAEGNNAQADDLLDQTQRILDTVQEKKDRAQAKIYLARIENASYAGRPLAALHWCAKLEPIAGDDPEILRGVGTVYYKNAAYQKAEPLMERALAIDEASFGKDHPNVARDLNNLALLYQATNRLSEAEPLMERALAIDEASFGKDHPNVAGDLNNLAQLYRDTNRLVEAEPLLTRAFTIVEARLVPEHPNTVTVRQNLDASRREMQAMEQKSEGTD